MALGYDYHARFHLTEMQAEEEMLRAEQEQQGEGAVLVLLIASPRISPPWPDSAHPLQQQMDH